VLGDRRLDGRRVVITGGSTRGVRPWARDPEVAEGLWRVSEECTGARFISPSA
jgi:hypothetical protein